MYRRYIAEPHFRLQIPKTLLRNEYFKSYSLLFLTIADGDADIGKQILIDSEKFIYIISQDEWEWFEHKENY